MGAPVLTTGVDTAQRRRVCPAASGERSRRVEVALQWRSGTNRRHCSPRTTLISAWSERKVPHTGLASMQH